VAAYASMGQFFTGGGVADAYTANAPAPRINPESLIDGMIIRFIAVDDNTGACTVNAFGLGNVDIKLNGGVLDPAGGDIKQNFEACLVYRTSYFELTNPLISNNSLGIFNGLRTTWLSGSSIEVKQGAASPVNGGIIMANNSTFAKTTASPWVSGSGNAGLASGASLSSDAPLYMFIVKLPNGSIDFIYDDNVTGANALTDTGAVSIRGVEAFYLDGSALIPEYQNYGNGHIKLESPVRTVNDTSPSTVSNTVAVPVPWSIDALAEIGLSVVETTGAITFVWLRDIPQANVVPSSGEMDVEVGTSAFRNTINKYVRVGNSGTVQYRASADSGSLTIRLFINGWIDNKNW